MCIKSIRWGLRPVFFVFFLIFLPAFLTGVSFERDAVAADNECNTVTIGTNSRTWFMPMNTYFHDSRTQVIYLSSEIGRSGTIAALALDVETVPGQDLNDWTIRMKHTTKSSYSQPSFEATDWTVVYQAYEQVDSNGWRTFHFSRPFEYNGVDNLMVDFSHNNTSYSSEGLCRVSIPGGTRSVFYYADSFYGDPLNWSGTSPPALGSEYVPNIRLMFCSIIGVDFNSDGIPNFYDYSYFSEFWGDASCIEPEWCGGRDLNRDGAVDIDDLQTFVLYWLWPAADLDLDGVVRMPDLADFSGQWGSSDCQDTWWCYGCDFDKSGSVDIYDLATLAEYWLTQKELW